MNVAAPRLWLSTADGELGTISTDLIFGLQQGLQLLQGLGQLILQQVTGAMASMGL